jgi:hypothetical protein
LAGNLLATGAAFSIERSMEEELHPPAKKQKPEPNQSHGTNTHAFWSAPEAANHLPSFGVHKPGKLLAFSNECNYLYKGVKWSPDGTCLLANAEDNILRLYEL